MQNDPANADAQTRAPNIFATNSNPPMHTQTQSTLAPTSEYVRYLLLALPARYIPRGFINGAFETNNYKGNALARGLSKMVDGFQNSIKIGHLPKEVKNTKAEQLAALSYGAVMGIGSLALSASYSRTVYNDIKNIFSEAVALETGKSPTEISRKDLSQSDNRIVQKTMENFWKRSLKRTVTDLAFFPVAAVRNMHLVDVMVGAKAGQAFGETWKRKTTMFEDLITFINNKINPRNGLGQTINVGEVFDLYQHYSEAFNPNEMFTNVLERGTGEGTRWAQSQPIFERITQLMNLTYAYKHSSKIDPETGRAVQQADFALPKFIYLLGHDLIDVNQPEKTLATIEVANRYGIPAVKEMQKMMAGGASIAQVNERFPTPHTAPVEKQKQSSKNGVLPKGSTMQLDALPESNTYAPATQIDAGSATLQSAISSGPSLSPAHA